MKQENETQNHTQNSNQNLLFEGLNELSKTVLITKQQIFPQQSKFQAIIYQKDEEGLKNLLRFKQNLAKKIIKKMKN
ncbi:unnamed protein product (macronuclear) [Paramecium tetraurelia]|uniref:Uncharacterized protein n=1 Tax=Paramecium tetraurelia TaxID=5888 RepID=A0CMQ2_PARTE|nr:uncharacterized protein GSPATT00008548001 [Paramecium tetraurelia]CAK72069.1 unnamed protein product [Paramecium tetraurelia]|eukprot:XP_001439466.1 hypothetical protein (macronuclear) [Paramecium tetraurelia strain d4-2]